MQDLHHQLQYDRRFRVEGVVIMSMVHSGVYRTVNKCLQQEINQKVNNRDAESSRGINTGTAMI